MGSVSRPKPSRVKVREHRERLREQGLRPIQIWVPDVRAPAFRSQAHRQSLAVAASARAREDQAFIECGLGPRCGAELSGPACRQFAASGVKSAAAGAILFRNGGWGGIRTHEGLPPGGFQDRCLQPLGHPSVGCPVRSVA